MKPYHTIARSRSSAELSAASGQRDSSFRLFSTTGSVIATLAPRPVTMKPASAANGRATATASSGREMRR